MTSLMLRQRGLSMIELMIAIAIGLFLLVGIVTVFLTSNRAYVELSHATEQIENGRYAVQLLSDDIGMAGFYGRYPAQLSIPGTLPDPCEKSTMSALRTAAGLPLQGYDAPSSVPSPLNACLADANHVAGTDILVVRRAATQLAAGEAATIPDGKLIASDIYIQANSDPTSTPIIGVGAGTQTSDQGTFGLKNKDGTNFAPVRQYEVHIYFVAPCSVPAGGGSVCTGASDDNGTPIPTLKRLELSADNTMTVVPLVEGIEDFQVDYGVDSDGDGVPDGAYTTAPATPADWANVVSVRINVLARNLQSTSDYSDSKVYDMGAAGTVSVAGGQLSDAHYKRHVYNTLIRVVNPAARRES